MGGWPGTVFPDSEGKGITGGTYTPPQQMREVLRSVTDLYQKSKGKIRSKLGPVNIPRPTGEELTERLIRDISTTMAVNFDIDYGGIRVAFKLSPNTAQGLWTPRVCSKP